MNVEVCRYLWIKFIKTNDQKNNNKNYYNNNYEIEKKLTKFQWKSKIDDGDYTNNLHIEQLLIQIITTKSL